VTMLAVRQRSSCSDRALGRAFRACSSPERTGPPDQRRRFACMVPTKIEGLDVRRLADHLS